MDAGAEEGVQSAWEGRLREYLQLSSAREVEAAQMEGLLNHEQMLGLVGSPYMEIGALHRLSCPEGRLIHGSCGSASRLRPRASWGRDRTTYYGSPSYLFILRSWNRRHSTVSFKVSRSATEVHRPMDASCPQHEGTFS